VTKIFLLLLIGLVCAPVALAQSRDYSNYEFYGGYAYERANNNADRLDRNATATVNGARVDFVSERRGYNGFEAEFVQNLTRHIGIVTSVSGTYNKTGYLDNLSGRVLRASVARYDIMAGPRYNWRGSRVTPFAHALFGVSLFHSSLNAPLTPHDTTDTAFAMAFGGGVDIHASDRFDLRAIQVDYVPSFFDGKRQDAIRASAGIKIK
jgi:opacity protein-like surface antigen